MKLFGFLVFFVLITSFSVTEFAFAEDQSTPDWFKNNKEWLAQGQIDDDTFFESMQYLNENNFVKNNSYIPTTIPQSDNVTQNKSNYLESIEYFVNFLSNSNVPGCEQTNSCIIPYVITVQVGDSVTWINDYGANTVSSGVVSDDIVGLEFDSGFMQIGTTFTHQFYDEGIYPYFSMVHPWASGIIIVEKDNSLYNFDFTAIIDGEKRDRILTINGTMIAEKSENEVEYYPHDLLLTIENLNGKNVKTFSIDEDGELDIDFENGFPRTMEIGMGVQDDKKVSKGIDIQWTRQLDTALFELDFSEITTKLKKEDGNHYRDIPLVDPNFTITPLGGNVTTIDNITIILNGPYVTIDTEFSLSQDSLVTFKLFDADIDERLEYSFFTVEDNIQTLSGNFHLEISGNYYGIVEIVNEHGIISQASEIIQVRTISDP